MKSVLVHSALAIGALIWAYTVWTSDEQAERPATAVEIVPCDARKFESLSFRSANTEVDLKRSDGAVWIHVKSPDPEKKNQDEQFAGNQAADEFLKSLTPLFAMRSLGKLSDTEIKDLDLNDTKTSLSIACAGKKHTLDIGGSTFGSADRYARFKKDNTVYLLQADLIANLESAKTRLMQRSLHRFKFADVDEVAIEVDKKTRTLLHRDRREPDKAQWVDKDKIMQRNEMYGNWLRKVESLRIQEYLPPGTEPGSGGSASSNKDKPSITTVMRLTYRSDLGNLGELTIAKGTGEPAEYYAKSEATRSWVKLIQSSANLVAQDARAIVGLEAASEPPSPVQSHDHSHAHP